MPESNLRNPDGSCGQGAFPLASQKLSVIPIEGIDLGRGYVFQHLVHHWCRANSGHHVLTLFWRGVPPELDRDRFVSVYVIGSHNATDSRQEFRRCGTDWITDYLMPELVNFLPCCILVHVDYDISLTIDAPFLAR